MNVTTVDIDLTYITRYTFVEIDVYMGNWGSGEHAIGKITSYRNFDVSKLVYNVGDYSITSHEVNNGILSITFDKTVSYLRIAVKAINVAS